MIKRFWFVVSILWTAFFLLPFLHPQDINMGSEGNGSGWLIWAFLGLWPWAMFPIASFIKGHRPNCSKT